MNHYVAISARSGCQCVNPSAHLFSSINSSAIQTGMEVNVDKMRKMDLMRYAASLGVATRKERSKAATWRAVKDVREDCMLRQSAQNRLCQLQRGGGIGFT